MELPTFTNLSGVEIPAGTTITVCGWPRENEHLVVTEFAQGDKLAIAHPMATAEVLGFKRVSPWPVEPPMIYESTPS